MDIDITKNYMLGSQIKDIPKYHFFAFPDELERAPYDISSLYQRIGEYVEVRPSEKINNIQCLEYRNDGRIEEIDILGTMGVSRVKAISIEIDI